MAPSPTAPIASPPPAGTAGGRLAPAIVCLVLVALPFLCVRFAPITDLPQHAAQVRLLGEALGAGHDLYRVQWWTPYGLSYLLPGLGWLVAGPLASGRVGFLLAAALAAGGLHGLAARQGRAPESAVVASVFVFSHVLYWGFLGFLAGWAAFTVWLRVTETNAAEGMPWRRGLRLLAGGALLYLVHALWFAAGCVWLVADGLRARVPVRGLLVRGLWLAPIGLVAALWYPGLAQRGFVSSAHWPDRLADRFSPGAFTGAALGGLRGPLEPLALAAVAAWIGVGLWQHRRAERGGRDPRLLLLAGLLGAAWAVLPVKAMNTLFLAERWLPWALAVLVLAVPAPRRSPVTRRLAVLGLAGFVAATSVLWMAFDRHEMAGFDALLAALPERPRVLGLDYSPQSPIVRGAPFLQAFAYAQVVRGGELGFSFADLAPSPVVYRVPRQPPWTSGLEWFPERVQDSDFAFFDVVMAHGAPWDQARLERAFGLEPVTPAGSWRLYRVPDRARRAAGRPPPAAPAVRLREVVSGLDRPLFVTHAGDGSGRLFVVEQGGRIRIVRDGRLLAQPFLDAAAWLDTSSGERGLLGLAFAPDFPRSGELFVAHTAPGPVVRVVRLRVSPDPDRADPVSAETVLAMADPAPNHNGGMLAFGPDGYLWIGTGDGGGAGDPWGNAQDPASLLGKILRLDVSRRPYAVPADNPLVRRPGARPEVWALGLRNPWRFSFDRATGELWTGDVGQGAWEEIDVEVPRRGGGLNYGWDRMEGRHCFEPRQGCAQAGLTLPVHEYGHDLGCSVTGGYVYRGRALPALAGRYLFADFCSGTVWALARGAGVEEAPAVERLLESGAMVSSLGEDEAGEVYLCDHRLGRLLVLAGTGG